MRHSAGAWSGKMSEVPSFRNGAHGESASHFGIVARLAHVLGKKITGWNVNSNRLYIQPNVELTTIARPRGRSGG